MKTNKRDVFLDHAILKLAASERGLQALRDLRTFLRNGGHGLDSENQVAVAIVLDEGFNRPGHTLELLDQAI